MKSSLYIFCDCNLQLAIGGLFYLPQLKLMKNNRIKNTSFIAKIQAIIKVKLSIYPTTSQQQQSQAPKQQALAPSTSM